ncbi:MULTISPECIES: MarR family winged helix-turn-helix transcriptional regulator [Alphaproteobacteria]|jgi:DNA-binding MarR family transcriptional regulator
MDELVSLLGEVSAAFQARLQELGAIRVLGLAPFQGRLLAILHRRPGSSQQELAAWTGRDKAQIARTIKELEAAGLLARTAHESDWRSHRLSLTGDGERACALLLKERAALSAAAMANLSVEERHLMAGALSKMKQQLDNLDAGETNHSSSE